MSEASRIHEANKHAAETAAAQRDAVRTVAPTGSMSVAGEPEGCADRPCDAPFPGAYGRGAGSEWCPGCPARWPGPIVASIADAVADPDGAL